MQLLRDSSLRSIEVVLPWSLAIDVDLCDGIGLTIASNGVWDLPITETIFRLVDPGEVAVDVGANIGYMTGAMGVRAGRSGRVLAFEPHPKVFSLLAQHCQRWQLNRSIAALEPYPLALGRSAGTALLFTNEHFDQNMGQARLHGIDGNATALEVPVKSLDEVLGETRVGLMKIDVEGAELEVLEGAAGLIAARRVRDIVFEDHKVYPTPVTELLESHGYSVALIHQATTRPKLVAPDDDIKVIGDRSYLATTEPRRAEARFSPFGWHALWPRLFF